MFSGQVNWPGMNWRVDRAGVRPTDRYREELNDFAEEDNAEDNKLTQKSQEALGEAQGPSRPGWATPRSTASTR